MDYQTLIDTLTPEVIERLRSGVETGRWPDGGCLTPEQKEHSLQAIIAWEEQNLPPEQRVGFIDLGSKGSTGGKGSARSQNLTDTEPDPLRWVDDRSEGGR